MAALTLGAERWEIAPFRLAQLRLAAPFLDRLATRAGGSPSLEAAAESAADMLGVLCAGLEGVDVAVLSARVGVEDFAAVRAAFHAVLEEAGLKPREAPAGEGTGAPAP